MSHTEIYSFSPAILDKFSDFEKFCSGEQEITSIKTLSQNTELLRRETGTLYFNRWQVLWIRVTYPLRWIGSLFFSSMAKLSSCIGIESLARRCTVLSQKMSRSDEQLKHQEEYGEKLLVPASNAHTINSAGIIYYGTIPYTSLLNGDPLLEALSFNNLYIMTGVKEGIESFFKTLEVVEGQSYSKEEIHKAQDRFETTYKRKGILAAVRELHEEFKDEKRLDAALNNLYDAMIHSEDGPITDHSADLSIYDEGGLCRGACFWFLYLYLKTTESFEDDESHLIAVARQFQEGVPPQGAFLQTLKEVSPLLHLRKVRNEEDNIPFSELQEDSSSTINSLAPGAYRVGLHRHSLVYIKIDEDRGYQWDPNAGLLKMAPKELLPWINEHHYQSEESHSTNVYFEEFFLDEVDINATQEGVI
ncbi:MAG: hypothetical protein KR126chlam1_01347 [Chlamydiae bacterium]|nr:hypothetical protein [Chlamydiota bacterium]